MYMYVALRVHSNICESQVIRGGDRLMAGLQVCVFTSINVAHAAVVLIPYICTVVQEKVSQTFYVIYILLLIISL